MSVRAILCLVIAGLITACLAARTPITRVDRTVVFLLIFFFYFSFLSALALGTKILTRFARRSSWTRFYVFQERAVSFWELFVPGALLLVNHLATIFGYKDVVFPETWHPVSSVPAQIAIAVLCLTVWFLLLSSLHGFAFDRLHTKRKMILVPCLFVSLFWLVFPESKAKEASPAVDSAEQPAPKRHKRPLVIIGLDGVDWRLLKAVVRQRSLRSFERMMEHGTSSSLDHKDYGLSPIIWTSMITGKDRNEHAIHDFLTLESPLFERKMDEWWDSIPQSLGVKSIFRGLETVGLVQTRVTTGEDRVGPSLWQILSHYGYSSLVANYMMSFPAERIEGVFLSDHVFHSVVKIDTVKTTEISPEWKLPSQGFEYPEGVLSGVGIRAEKVSIDEEDIIRFAEAEFDYLSKVSLSLMASRPYDLVVFYTPFPDSLNHLLSVEDYHDILEADFSGEGSARFARVYAKLDRYLGQVFEAVPNANVILLSDHGVSTGYKYNQHILQHVYAPKGIFIAMGPDVSKGGAVATVSMFDILPTVLNYFGLPLARDFEGGVVEGLFETTHTVEFIESYDPLVSNERVMATLDNEAEGVKKRLRALGYVQ